MTYLILFLISYWIGSYIGERVAFARYLRELYSRHPAHSVYNSFYRPIKNIKDIN